MSANENHVYAVALQLGKNNSGLTPESVIYGYAKLLSMDEAQVRSLIGPDSMQEFEAAHKWFSDNKLDLKLIKSGLMLLFPFISDESNPKTKEFSAFVDQSPKEISSTDILTKALSYASIDILSHFSTGKDMDEVFNYQKELKEKAQASKDSTDANNIDDKAQKDGKDQKGEKSQKDDKDNKEKKDNGEKAGKSSEKSREKDVASIIDSIKESEPEKKADLKDLATRYRELTTALLDKVKGQEQAIMKFVQGYNEGIILKDSEKKNRPRSYFFFFGPPGVGKTYLAENASEVLKLPYKIYNMSEYASSQSHEEMIGTAKIYSNSRSGSLTEFVKNNPECLLVFDEIEKAHIHTIRLFLQILGSGKLRDVNKDEDVSFRDATIIFTSNVGRELYADRSVNLSTLPEKVLIDAITKERNEYGEPALPPEICSRIASGNTVIFNHLSIRYLTEMVSKTFDDIVSGMETEYNVNIKYSKYLPSLFIYNRGGEIDARVAVGQSGRFFKNELYELLRQMENSRPSGAEMKSLELDVEWDEMSDELKQLFINKEKSEILIFAQKDDALFKDFDDSKYVIHFASTLAEAEEILKNDISAIFIDPFFGKECNDDTVMSFSDYATKGIRFFHNLMDSQSGIPTYLLETDGEFSEVDKTTLMQEGATGTLIADKELPASFQRQLTQIMEELYMEKRSQEFTQRGWVIDFKTKQEWTKESGSVKITFYGLRKRRAVDVESRGSILSDAERPNTKFRDVIGAENAKEELKYFVKYLQNPKQFLSSGGRPPKGVLLYGPPGTGKTMLARAMAGESDVTFIQTSAAEFLNKYVGGTEENIKKLFVKAKKYAPAIIFIDEIDAIGKKRSGSELSSHTETALNALLTQMDGFSGNDMKKPIFVLAATNYGVNDQSDGIASLDDALIRRFDNKIYVDLPKESERKEYILLQLKKKNITTVSDDIAQNIAERTTGQSLAILQNVLDLAIRNATKEGKEVTNNDLLNALEDYCYGEKKVHTPEYYKSVAIHETGHAFVAYLGGDKPSYITIESRGHFGGYMQHANSEEDTGYTKEELLSRIRTSLAGRAAELVFYGEEKAINTGASSDLSNATNLAFSIVLTYGMDGSSLVVLKKDDVMKSALAGEYVSKVNAILEREMKNTIEIIEKNKAKIEAIADVLARENKLTGEQFDKLMSEQ